MTCGSLICPYIVRKHIHSQGQEDEKDEEKEDNDLETELSLEDDSDKMLLILIDEIELTDTLTEELTDSLLNEETEALDPELVLELESAEQHGQPVLLLPTFLNPRIHSQNHNHAWQTHKH